MKICVIVWLAKHVPFFKFQERMARAKQVMMRVTEIKPDIINTSATTGSSAENGIETPTISPSVPGLTCDGFHFSTWHASRNRRFLARHPSTTRFCQHDIKFCGFFIYHCSSQVTSVQMAYIKRLCDTMPPASQRISGTRGIDKNPGIYQHDDFRALEGVGLWRGEV